MIKYFVIAFLATFSFLFFMTALLCGDIVPSHWNAEVRIGFAIGSIMFSGMTGSLVVRFKSDNND